MIEAMKRAYADRALFLGDPDVVKVPVARLIVEALRRANGAPRIDPARATPSSDIRADAAPCRGRRATPRISR